MTSLEKVFDILELFLHVRQDEVRLTDIARATGLTPATVNRIASILVKRGYLVQKEKRGKYSLGTHIIYFTSVLKQKSMIKELAKPFLLELNNRVKDTVILVNWDGKNVYFVDEIQSQHPLRIIPDHSAQTPLYCSGVGKIFLANMSDEELEKYCKNVELKAYTTNTITDFNQLKKHLKVVAKEGVAFDDEELYLGVRNIVVGIKDSEGRVVSAVGVLGPTVRLTRKRIKAIMPDIKNCAMQISKGLGYHIEK